MIFVVFHVDWSMSVRNRTRSRHFADVQIVLSLYVQFSFSAHGLMGWESGGGGVGKGIVRCRTVEYGWSMGSIQTSARD